MKNVKLFSMALAALMLGACSSDEVATDNSQNGPQWTADGKGYINLAINLPTQPSTRAWDEGSNLDDGTPTEYDVKDATLILFTGAAGASDASCPLTAPIRLTLTSTTRAQVTKSRPQPRLPRKSTR